ncbi:MAG: hypothetical protein WC840_04405 [Candidatus Peribacteraceae bacterium]
MSAVASGREYERTPWDIVFGRTPAVEDLGQELYSAFETIFRRLQAVALGGETSPEEKRAAAQSIWGLQQADRLLALRQSHKDKDVPPQEVDRFRNLKVEQMSTILRMQQELLSAAKALMAGHEVTNPSSVDGPPDASSPL